MKAIPRRDKKILSADYPCTYFCAAGVALKRQAFSQAGGFWDKLFIYAEELDLSYRIIDKGFDIIHCVSIDVMHSETPSARPNDRYLRLASRNRIWVAFRNLPFPNAVVMSVAWSIKHALMSIKTGQLLAVLDGLKLALLGLKYAIQKRKKLTPGTMKKLQELSGRVWY